MWQDLNCIFKIFPLFSSFFNVRTYMGIYICLQILQLYTVNTIYPKNTALTQWLYQHQNTVFQ